MPLKYATPSQTPNVDTFGNAVKIPDLVRDNRSSASSPNIASVSSQSQSTGGNANLDGNSNRVTNDPSSNPNGDKNTNRVGGGGNSVGNGPSTPRPVNNPSTTAPNSKPSNTASQVSSPAASVSRFGGLLNSPLAKASIPAIVGAVLSIPLNALADALGNSLVDPVKRIDEALGQRPDPAAKQALDNATKRYQKALLDKQKTNPINSRGSDPLTGTKSSAALPFTANDKPDGWNRTYYTDGQPNGFSIVEDVSIRNNRNTTFAWIEGFTPQQIIDWHLSARDRRTSVRLIINSVVGVSAEGTGDGTPIIDIQWHFIANGFVAKQYPEIVVRDGYAPPLDKPVDKGDLKDPNNPHSPNFFPWLPTLPVNQSDALQPNLQPNPANDNKFKQPEKPIFAPVIPTPSQSPVSPLANSSPAYSTPATTKPASSTSKPDGTYIYQAGGKVFRYMGIDSNGKEIRQEVDPVTGKNINSGSYTVEPVTTTPTRSDTAKLYDKAVSNFQKDYSKNSIFDPITGQRVDGDPSDNFQKNYLKNAVFNPSTGERLDRQRVTTTPTRSDVSPSQSQNPLTKPLNPPIPSPVTPIPNSVPDLGTIALGITALGVTTGAALTGIDYLKNLNQQINNQTTPQAQQTNAQQGVCNAFQPQQCGYEGTKQAATEATNPIKDVATANNGLLGNILAILDNLVTFLQGQLGKILSFLDKSIVDRAMGAANFAMNVHNALMLSNNLGKTLATVVDTALNFTGFKFYDATNGNATTASRAFNQNVSSIIVSLIGQDQYTELTNEWKVANRIYQSSTSLLNKTERLLGAQSKVAQKGNIDVANIGNALLVNGTVNPNSYPPMAATKEANTPPDLIADVNSPLSSFAGQVRNLNTITKSVNSTLRNVSGIQKDFGKLADLTNSESKVRKSIRSGAASQAKIRAKFTFLQIKQIKTTGKR